MDVRFLRHWGAVVLLVAGIFVAAFSIAIAFGWGHRTLSMVATIALAGYAAVVAAYFLVRDSDWEPVASACVKLLLILGSGLFIPGITAVIAHVQREYFPSEYFVATGCSSIIAYLWFRTYAAR